MKKIQLSYRDGHLFSVYVVRYFRFKNNNYFMYTFREKDEQNYMKLYVVKVMKELGFPVTQTIRSNSEWNSMKTIVKKILKEMKKGEVNSIKDLDCSELEKIIIYENRSFQLAQDLVNLLTKVNALEESKESFSAKNQSIIDIIETVDNEKTLNVDKSKFMKEETEIEILEL